MLGMNIRTLRQKNKWSQEELAEKLQVSRQTVAKWENDEVIPDMHKGKILSDIFQVDVNQMSQDWDEKNIDQMAPKGKQFFGVVKVGERGQIVIPKQARELYNIEAGDQLVALGEDATQGLAFLKSEGFIEMADKIQKADVEESDSE